MVVLILNLLWWWCSWWLVLVFVVMLVVDGADFLWGLMVIFVVVNGSFVWWWCCWFLWWCLWWFFVVVSGGGYVFYGFCSMSLLLMGFSNIYVVILQVLNCAQLQKRSKLRLHGFLVGLMVILDGFCIGWVQDLFMLLLRRVDFGFWRWLFGYGV